jgi:MFS family permease
MADATEAPSEAARGGVQHVAIAAYGAAFYAFGVLLGPILDDTDWSEAVVAGAFSASTLIGAFGAALAGRFVDAIGACTVMLVGGWWAAPLSERRALRRTC